MMITSNHDAHVPTGNTAAATGQGHGAGPAAALCATRNFGTWDLACADLRQALLKDGAHLEN